MAAWNLFVIPVANPDPLPPGGQQGGGGFDLLALLAFFPSVILSFFTQNKGGGARSATVCTVFQAKETCFYKLRK